MVIKIRENDFGHNVRVKGNKFLSSMVYIPSSFQGDSAHLRQCMFCSLILHRTNSACHSRLEIPGPVMNFHPDRPCPPDKIPRRPAGTLPG